MRLLQASSCFLSVLVGPLPYRVESDAVRWPIGSTDLVDSQYPSFLHRERGVGWVEGMAPVFSRSAWHCAWHLIQNDLIHGWGMDMKLGYCAQGDRTQKVGVVDSEFVVHQGVQTLGGSSRQEKHRRGTLDARVEVRRQARAELESFQERWDRATRQDDGWIDPFLHHH